MDKFELNLTASTPELLIRQGSAPNIYDPVPVTLTGTITAPADYANWELDRLAVLDNEDEADPFTSRAQFAATLEGLVVANYTSRTIELTTKPREKTGVTRVVGKLELNPELAKLTVNAQKTYDEKGLLALLKFAGAYFENRSAHEAIMMQLKKFKAVINTEFTNADDYKGAAAIGKITKITHDVPLEFVLAMPIFGGGDIETFKVDICVGLVAGDVDFWLESTDLHELVIVGTSAIFEEQLERLKQFAIIKQY